MRCMRAITSDDLLDDAAWDVPWRLSEDDLHVQDGLGWRRADARLDDLENER